MRLSRVPAPARTALLAAAAALAGYLCMRWGVPVPWLIGPLTGALVLALLTKVEWPVPGFVQQTGQAILGMVVGFGFSSDAFRILGQLAIPLTGVLVLTALLSLMNGLILARVTRVDPVSAFLGTLPGAASALMGVSSEMGADARSVAVLQLLRLLILLAAAPFFIHSVAGGAPAAATVSAAAAPSPGSVGPIDLLILALVGAAGAYLAKLLRIPGPAFLGPCLLSLVLTTTGLWHVEMSDSLVAVGTAGIGAWVGSRFDVAGLRRLGRAALVEGLLVILLMAGTAGIGLLFHRVTGVDLLTSLLGTVPGAMDAMIILSEEEGGNTSLIAAMHLIRQILLMLLGPWLIQNFLGRERSDVGA